MRAFRGRDVLIVVACLIVAALWIDFSKIHRLHNSDSVLFTLMSLYQWEPLVWEQDRIGMLFPLLAMPWRHPLDNLLAQGAMTTFVSLASFFLLGYYVAGRRLGIAIGALGALLLMLFCRLEQRFAFLIYIHQFATAAAFGMAGLILLDWWARGRGRFYIALGFVCLLISHWLNPAMAFALGPLLLMRGLCFRGLPEYFDQRIDAQTTGGDLPDPPAFVFRPSKDEVVGLAAIGVSFVASLVLSRTMAEPLPYHVLPPGEWLACAVGLWNNLTESFQHRWFRAVDVAGIVGLCTLFWPAGRRMAPLSLRLVAGLLVAALIQFAFMTSLDHVHRIHHGRYGTIAVLLWQTALLAFAVIQVGAVLPVTAWSRRLPVLLTVAMTLAVMLVHGWASPSVVRREIDDSLGKYSPEILAANCTHVTGDYWHVWTAMFHANMCLADDRSSRTVWGIAQRSLPTEKYWRQIPLEQIRIAEIVGDEQRSAQARDHYRIPPVVPAEQFSTIRVLTAPPTVLNAGGQVVDGSPR